MTGKTVEVVVKAGREGKIPPTLLGIFRIDTWEALLSLWQKVVESQCVYFGDADALALPVTSGYVLGVLV